MTPAVEVGKGVYDARFLKAIDWATQVNEEERPQSIAEWREAFSEEDSPSPPPPPETDRFGLLSKLALTVVGVAVLGTRLWMLGVPSSSTAPTAGTGQEPVSGQAAQPAALTRPAAITPAPAVQGEARAGDASAEWERVKALDTATAYREFVDRYPDHPIGCSHRSSWPPAAAVA